MHNCLFSWVSPCKGTVKKKKKDRQNFSSSPLSIPTSPFYRSDTKPSSTIAYCYLQLNSLTFLAITRVGGRVGVEFDYVQTLPSCGSSETHVPCQLKGTLIVIYSLVGSTIPHFCIIHIGCQISDSNQVKLKWSNSPLHSLRHYTHLLLEFHFSIPFQSKFWDIHTSLSTSALTLRASQPGMYVPSWL